MGKVAFAIKINEDILEKLKSFCKEHGTKYSFFVEEAIKGKLEEEELREDILDMKTLSLHEKDAVPFEDYLRSRGV